LFSKPKRSIGLDIGTHSVKAVQMSRSGGRLYVDEVGEAPIDRMQVNEDPVMAHGMAVRDALLGMPLQNTLVVAALPGQTAVIRYPRLVNVGPEMMDLAVEKEAGQNIPYDLAEVYLDWTLLSEQLDGDQKQLKVLLVAAKHEVIDARVQILNAAELECAALGVDSLALADAAEACGYLHEGETVALINIGLSSASIHFVKDGVSNFIRDVSWGARELIQAVAKDRRIDFDEAQRQLHRFGEEPEAEAEPAEVAAAPVEESLEPDSGDIFGDSLSGGGSLLDPLDEELGGGGLSGKAPMPAHNQGNNDMRQVLAGPLARLVAEVRRSFDYYEHQLYERPVDRIILSGGVAEMPFLGERLQEELGLEAVEVADPTNCALLLGDDMAVRKLREQPAAFMVAIGLAARGMADI